MLVACTSDGGGPTPTCGDGHNVSYKNDIVPLIGHCGAELCHGGIGQSWPYAAIVSKPASECTDHRLLVAPGDPDSSYLLQKLEGVHMCAGEKMPKGGTMTTAELQTITDWICNGAPNN